MQRKSLSVANLKWKVGKTDLFQHCMHLFLPYCTFIEGLEVLLEQRAADLFAICDQEDKGFVTKRDMQRLRNQLPLTPEQLG